jgi:hypothetical protein
MKTQHETSIQFSGYPLSIAEPIQKNKIVELVVVKPSTDPALSPQKNSIGNDPENWDIDWFNSYE